jgi:hypothetical protein
MSAQIPNLWLEHGVYQFNGMDNRDRFSHAVRDGLRQASGEELKIQHWPEHGFKYATYWHVDPTPHPAQSRASWRAMLDHERGAFFACGVSVEKGVEVADRIRPERPGLDPSWDWYRFQQRLDRLPEAIAQAQRTLGGQTLYLWCEYGYTIKSAQKTLGQGKIREQIRTYYVIRDGVAYERIGYKPTSWSKVADLLRRPYPQLWGHVSIMRLFGLDDCTPAIDADNVIEVCAAMLPVYRLWRMP